MELESLHKYLSILQINPNLTEVLFSGQPCMNVSKIEDDAYMWAPNPVFAKLTYGANTFSDLPYGSAHDTLEEAIADGLVKFEELGSFNTLVDLPEDTYTATQIAEAVMGVYLDCLAEASKRTQSVTEASTLANQLVAENIVIRVPSSTSNEQIEESVTETITEVSKKDEITTELKKQRKFVSKYGSGGMYAVDSDLSGSAE